MSERELILLLPPSDFPGAALLALVTRLHQHAVPYRVAGPVTGRLAGSGGVHVTATLGLDAVAPAERAGLVVLDDPSGGLRARHHVLELLREAHRADVLVCAVGEGVLALADAGVLGGCAVAADTGTADRLRARHAAPLLEPIVVCGRLVTATEAGAAALGDTLHDLRGLEAAGPELGGA